MLSGSFITTPTQPLLKCFQHDKEDGSGFRPGSRELLVVIPSLLLLSLTVSPFLSVIPPVSSSREPPFHVDIDPPSRPVFTLDEGCVFTIFPPLLPELTSRQFRILTNSSLDYAVVLVTVSHHP